MAHIIIILKIRCGLQLCITGTNNMQVLQSKLVEPNQDSVPSHAGSLPPSALVVHVMLPDKCDTDVL